MQLGRTIALVGCLASVCGLCHAQAPCEGTWRTFESPTPRAWPTLFTLEERTYLAGGSGGAFAGELWRSDADGWRRVEATGMPAIVGAIEHRAEQLVYAVTRDGQTWTWDGATWIRVIEDGPSGSVMLYDSQRQRVLLFPRYPETQILAFTGDRWTAIGPMLDQGGGNVVYDSARDAIVLFGGIEADQYEYFGERWLWEYDFGDRSWTRIPEAGSWPAGRYGNAMYFDEINQEVVIAGGQALRDRMHACLIEYFPRADSWAWDGLAWRRVGSAPGQIGMVATYDPANSRAVLVGGYQRRQYSPDCEEREWYFNNLMVRTDGAWTDMPGKIAPKHFEQFRVAYHPSRGLLAHGGQSIDPLGGDIYVDDESSVYLDQGRFGSGPRGYEASAGDLAYDPVRGEMVGFGGNTHGFVEDNTATLAASGAWVVRSPTVRPPARALHAMGWDPGIERVLMYGGNAGDRRLWQWDGTNWHAHPVEGPDLGQNAAMVYEPGAAAMLVVGASGQSWYFDARATEPWLPTGAPNLGITNARLISIPGYGIIAGAKDGFATPLYRWTGGGWELITDRPGGRVEDFGYDPAVKAVVFSSEQQWMVWHWTPPCRVDLDCDGQLTIFDFLAFSNAFDARLPAADFDGDGEFTIFDFLAFQNDFQDGCG